MIKLSKIVFPFSSILFMVSESILLCKFKKIILAELSKISIVLIFDNGIFYCLPFSSFIYLVPAIAKTIIPKGNVLFLKSLTISKKKNNRVIAIKA